LIFIINQFLFCLWKINTVKKLILFALASLVITSCKKDNDDDTISIVGTWKLNKTETKYGNGTTSLVTPNTCEAQSFYNFGNDGKLAVKIYYNDNSSCLNSSYSGIYSYDSGKKLITVTENSSTKTVSVEQLTSSDLIFVGAEDEDYDSDGKSDKTLVHLKK